MKKESATLITFSCRPNSGSEWGVGWNYLLMLSELYGKVNLYVRDAEMQPERIKESLDKLNIKNVKINIVPDPVFSNSYIKVFNGSRSLSFIYIFWLLKVWLILVKNKSWKTDSSIFHITWVSDWIWSPFIILPYSNKTVGPLGSQPPNFNSDSLDYYGSRFRYLIKSLIRLNPLNWLNAFLADNAIGISKVSVNRLPWSLVKNRIVISPVHSELGIKTKKRDDEKVILFIGKHLDFKNIDLFVFVSKNLLEKDNSIKIVVLGDTIGAINSDLSKFQRQYPDNVIIKGKVPHSYVESILCSHLTIMLQTSSEAGGTAPIEAITCGVPVICVKGYGLEAFIDSGYDYSVSFENKKSFSEQVEMLTNDIWSNYNVISNDILDLSSRFTHDFSCSKLRTFLSK